MQVRLNCSSVLSRSPTVDKIGVLCVRDLAPKRDDQLGPGNLSESNSKALRRLPFLAVYLLRDTVRRLVDALARVPERTCIKIPTR